MDAIIEANDPTANDALNALESWANEPGPAVEFSKPEASATEPTAPAMDSKVAPKPPANDGEGTPKTEVDPTTDTNPKPTEVKPTEATTPKPAEPSKFQKAQQRLSGSWEELNKAKEDFRATAKAAEAREALLLQKEQALAAREAKAAAPKHPPEAFEARAAELEAEAQRVEAEIKRLDDAGEYSKADRLREENEPNFIRRDAKKFRAHAAELRANPPAADPTLAQQEAQRLAAQKEWWGKAAVDFPNIAVEGTPERAALVNLIKTEPGIVNNPKGMYYASRMVQAETSALRVPQLVKDLEAATARVKELEQLTAVPSDGAVPQAGGSPKSFEQMSYAEQLAVVEADARGLSAFP